jgi:hypothetical protein
MEGLRARVVEEELVADPLRFVWLDSEFYEHTKEISDDIKS